MNNLISITDFTENKFLTQNLKSSDIDPYIGEAQDFDLKPVLGDALYYDLMNNQTTTKYVELINGKSYIPNGQTATIQFKGLKMVLKYYTYARLVVVDGVKSTQAGFLQKSLENSERISGTQRAQMIAQARSGAKAYEDDMIKFLNNFQTTYTLWSCSLRKNKGFGFRIKAV